MRGAGLMGSVQLGFVATIAIAIASLFAGIGVNRTLPFLRRWNIPDVVTGGLLAACLLLLVQMLFAVRIDFHLASRDILLLYFFSTIGLNIRFSEVRSGGRPLAILLGLTAALMVMQNLVAGAGTRLLGLPEGFGVLLGSLALSGGHGTAIAWAPLVDAHFGMQHSLEIGIAVATLGLVAGSVLGGPLAHVLISRHRLSASDSAPPVPAASTQSDADDGKAPSATLALLQVVVIIHVAILCGSLLDLAFVRAGINVPLFVPVLVASMLLANLLPRAFPGVRWPMRSPSLATVSDISLNLFLAISLMGMQLAHLGGYGMAIILMVVVHAALVCAYILWVVYPLMGRNYDAAVVAAGFTGIGLGSTATAFANMSAVASTHGPSPRAWMVVSLVAALFLDAANSILVSLLMR